MEPRPVPSTCVQEELWSWTQSWSCGPPELVSSLYILPATWSTCQSPRQHPAGKWSFWMWTSPSGMELKVGVWLPQDFVPRRRAGKLPLDPRTASWGCWSPDGLPAHSSSPGRGRTQQWPPPAPVLGGLAELLLDSHRIPHWAVMVKLGPHSGNIFMRWSVRSQPARSRWMMGGREGGITPGGWAWCGWAPPQSPGQYPWHGQRLQGHAGLQSHMHQRLQFSSVQSLSHVWLFVTPWTSGHQGSLSITNSWNLLKLTSIESVMPSSHLILCCPLLLLPSIFPSVRVFPNESALHISWPKYWSFSFNVSPSNEHPGLIALRMDWLNLLWVQGTLKSLLQHHSSKASQMWSDHFLRARVGAPGAWKATVGAPGGLLHSLLMSWWVPLLHTMLSTLVMMPWSQRTPGPGCWALLGTLCPRDYSKPAVTPCFWEGPTMDGNRLMTPGKHHPQQTQLGTCQSNHWWGGQRFLPPQWWAEVSAAARGWGTSGACLLWPGFNSV